jgi:hypothetical protein
MYDLWDVALGFVVGVVFSFVSFAVSVWFKTKELGKDSDRADVKAKQMVV